VTADDLREALTDAGLSQRGTAKELGIDERTMRRYAAGQSPIPTVVEYAIRWVAQRARRRAA
jgi:transcriptional regulator with XRE-family HTH domain